MPIWRTDTPGDYFTIYSRARTVDNGYMQIAYIKENTDDVIWMTNTQYDIEALHYYDKVNMYL